MLRSNRFTVRELAAREMSNRLLSLPAVAGESLGSLGATLSLHAQLKIATRSFGGC
jgi:hypothetical protein